MQRQAVAAFQLGAQRCSIAWRRTMAWFIDASKRTQRFLPSSLARYIAVSALLTRASMSGASSGKDAMPALHVTFTC